MTSFKINMTTAIILFTLFYTVAAFWRLPCPRQIGVARIDPLVAAGAISNHAHVIHGGSSTFTPLLRRYHFYRRCRIKFSLSWNCAYFDFT